MRFKVMVNYPDTKGRKRRGSLKFDLRAHNGAAQRGSAALDRANRREPMSAVPLPNFRFRLEINGLQAARAGLVDERSATSWMDMAHLLCQRSRLHSLDGG